MSPVFRHGRLRLYLLKLLDESPRHGYEVIRLLQDRFLGVYAPSPGTIYPRLARLEEDGLVTHEEVDGKKIYSITDKGREEIRSRFSDLADLEDELTESLRDVAREISEDVRETVRGIREDLTAAAREFRNQQSDRVGPDAARNPSAPSAAFTSEPKSDRGADDDSFAADEARRIRDEARRAREEMRARFRARSRDRADSASGQDSGGRHDWAGWASPWSTSTNEPPDSEAGARSGRSGRGPGYPFRDLEQMAMQFANELRAAARQAGGVGERSMNDLRDILTDTLAKVRMEVFSEGNAKSDKAHEDDKPAGDGDKPASGPDSQ